MALTLTKFLVNLKTLKSDLPFIIKNILEKKSQEFINANVESWNQGNLPDGSQLVNKYTGATDYSLGWTVTRKEKGLPTGHYYLQFTGELAKSIIFEVKINGSKVEGELKPQSFVKDKATDMENMFGKIFGISDKNITIFVEWFKVELTKEIKLKLFAP